MTDDLTTGDRLQVLRVPEARCYLLRYLSGPKRTRILDLFGVDTLPLPWTTQARMEEVLADVRRLHPNTTLEKGGDPWNPRAYATASGASPILGARARGAGRSRTNAMEISVFLADDPAADSTFKTDAYPCPLQRPSGS